MLLAQKTSVVMVVGLLISASPAAAQTIARRDRITTHTQTQHRVQDELFTNYSPNDLRELSRRAKERAKSLQENARKQQNNLMPMQGKARLIVLNAKEQSFRMKQQQKARNRILQDKLSDLKRRNEALSQNRADVKLKSRLDR